MNQIRDILAVHKACNLTRPRFEKLNEFFTADWQKVRQAKISDWQQAGVDKKAIEKFFAAQKKLCSKAEEALLQKCGANVLTLNCEAYPQSWRPIAQSPALVFVRGNVDNLNTKSVAVVGSRNITDYGQIALQKILEPVFRQNVTVVSGLAFGVDAAAHKLALDCSAPTVAVLGNGIDAFYPKNNDLLGKKILQSGGTVVSEHWPNTEARPENFPKRNRLVASLSRATIVVEAALKSGSLITAGLANEYGKDVWAVPGDVFRASSAGCNQLIARGEAAPLLHHQQLIENLCLGNAIASQKIDLTNEEKVLVKTLATKNTWEINDFLTQFDAAPALISSTLTLLELKGVVQKQGNKIYLT